MKPRLRMPEPLGRKNRRALADELRGGSEGVSITAKPKTRGDCIDGPRPCPWVSCRHHNAIEVSAKGVLFVLDGESAPSQSCSLDVGDGMTLQEVGDVFGITRERVRQIEVKAMANGQFSEHGLGE